MTFMETGGTGLSESCEKMGYSILTTEIASPALHRLHFVICDFRPPSVAESGEAALRRLLASRAIGSYSSTSDDPAPGSPTVFQSSRVVRPQDASKFLTLCHYSAAQLVLTWIRISSVHFILVLRLLSWKLRWDQPVVTLIQFSSTAGVTTWA